MKNKGKTLFRTEGAEKNWRIALFAVLFLAALIPCVLYFQLTTTPIAGFDISPSRNLERWQFSLEDGTALTPADGKLPLTGTDTVVLCRTELTDALSDHPCFTVTANSVDCAVYLNDDLVYAPSGRFDGERFAASGYKASSASGQFIASLPGGHGTLTMRVQFQGKDDLVKHLPRLTAYHDVIAYQSQSMATTAESAFPAGMYFALALFLSALFFMGAWKDKPDAGLLLLAFCALSLSLTNTAPYTLNVAWTLLWASISIFCSLLPLVAMTWTLWYRLSRRPRRILLPVIGFVSAVVLYYLIAGLGQGTTLNAQINVLQIWVIPGTVLLTLIVAAIDAAKGNAWFRRLFRFLAWSVPAVALAWLFSILTDGKLAQSMATTIQQTINYHSLFRPCEQLCILLLILMFIQAVSDLISGLVRRDAELQALSLREKYAAENLKLMLETQESTYRERHEMRHHIALIDEMLSSGQTERAQTYAHSLLDKVTALPSDTYSTNPIINAIAGRYLNEAKSEGISVSADIHTADKIPLHDDELCVLLTNMLENALEACGREPVDSARFIRLKLRASDEHLSVICENSTNDTLTIREDECVNTSKPAADYHGFGIPAMRRIAEKRGGKFSVTCTNGCFTVKVIL